MVSKRTPPLSKSKAAAILSKLTRLPSPTALLSTAASAAATTMFLRSLAKNYLPSQLNTYLHSKLHHLLSSLFTETTLLIYEYDALNKNKLFSAAALYVGAIAGPSAVTCRASLPPRRSISTSPSAAAKKSPTNSKGFRSNGGWLRRKSSRGLSGTPAITPPPP